MHSRLCCNPILIRRGRQKFRPSDLTTCSEPIPTGERHGPRANRNWRRGPIVPLVGRGLKEILMKLKAIALALCFASAGALALPDGVQARTFGGGFRGFHGAGFSGGGFRAAGWRGGGWRGAGLGWRGAGWRAAAVGWRGGGWGWRGGGWGWGGLGLGLAGAALAGSYGYGCPYYGYGYGCPSYAYGYGYPSYGWSGGWAGGWAGSRFASRPFVRHRVFASRTFVGRRAFASRPFVGRGTFASVRGVRRSWR